MQGTSYASPMKLINNIFNSDLAFNVRRDEDSLQNGQNGEVSVSARVYALISGEMCLQALTWHTDAKVPTKTGKSFSAAEDDMADVYPLQLRFSVVREMSSLAVKVIKKDNAIELSRRACKIFSVESEQLHIWDFSGQITLSFMCDRNNLLKDCWHQSDWEVVIVLSNLNREGKKVETLMNHVPNSSSGASPLMNGGSGSANFNLYHINSLVTCWAFNQHDSQELLAFLLDGLHKDLNRVKSKPYIEVKNGEGRPDEEVADEYWQNHLVHNDSIIVEVCQGQFKSTLFCPVRKNMSFTFDPFIYLSLPLPSTTMRTMTLTVISTVRTAQPIPYTITVPKSGKFEDLIQALGAACSLGVDETLLVAESFLPLKKWYCPSCKRHRQAIKKLDLRRLPEIPVIHLKRLSYSRFLKNKLETYIDFLVDNLDLSSYIPHKNSQLSNCYMLYAASNHYGSMGGGH
ncbi:hypothetical protein SLA2020_336950 [Shorea laevis]